MSPARSLAEARAEWRLDPDVAFLNHGSFGASPATVLDEQQRWREEMERQPVAFLERRIEGLLDQARARIAPFLGAEAEGLAFVPNATTGVNTVLRRMGLGPGDEVVMTDHAYPAVLNTVRLVCAEVGARAVVVPLELPWAGDAEERVSAALTPETRLVVLDHVASPTAVLMPIEPIAAACRARGVPVLVDAAHAPGMLPVDVAGLGADFWTGNFHKWVCAPKGAAALWVAPEHRDRIRPLVSSHEHLRSFHAAFDWTGTYDPSAILSVPAALDFLAGFGWEELRARNHALVIQGRARVEAAIGTPGLVPDEVCGWMAIAGLPDGVASTREQARALTALLYDEHRIEVPFVAWNGRGLLRLSAHAYNVAQEYERLAEVLPGFLAGVQTTSS